MIKRLMAQETCACTRRLEFVQARLRRLFHLKSASAQDPHEIEGLPLARRRSASCSQPLSCEQHALRRRVQTMRTLECQLLTMEI